MLAEAPIKFQSGAVTVPPRNRKIFTTKALSASFHKYGDVCGERDGVEFAGATTTRCPCASGRRSDKEIGAVPPPPFGLMGVVDDLRCRSLSLMSRHRLLLAP